MNVLHFGKIMFAPCADDGQILLGAFGRPVMFDSVEAVHRHMRYMGKRSGIVKEILPVQVNITAIRGDGKGK